MLTRPRRFRPYGAWSVYVSLAAFDVLPAASLAGQPPPCGPLPLAAGVKVKLPEPSTVTFCAAPPSTAACSSVTATLSAARPVIAGLAANVWLFGGLVIDTVGAVVSGALRM